MSVCVCVMFEGWRCLNLGYTLFQDGDMRVFRYMGISNWQTDGDPNSLVAIEKLC